MSKLNRNMILDKVTSTIVYEMENVGVFHYNKLAYLFEYFYIKNFGERYSSEKFIKQPHGPVIPNYHKQISLLIDDEVIDGDKEEILAIRNLDEDYFIRKNLSKNENTFSFLVENRLARLLIIKVINKYGHLNSMELEEVVYKTPPVKKYLENSQAQFVKEIGGYILKSANIKIKEGKENLSEPMKLAFSHLKKYNHINYNQLKQDVKDFSFLEDYRPVYGDIIESNF
jgi:uncharacterized phage-associated protein